MIYQAQAAECGLACVAMIANHYGHEIDMHTLRSRYQISMSGANLQHLISLAAQLKLSGRALKLDLPELKKLTTPCILHWQHHHYVVLQKVTKRGLVILDPAIGKRLITWPEADQAFTGVALELAPTIEFAAKKEATSLRLASLLTNFTGLRSTIAKLLLVSLLLQLTVLATPYYTQIVVDEVLVTHDQSLLAVLALGFFLVLLAKALATAMRSYLILNFSSQLGMHFSANLMRHLLHLPSRFFATRHIGDITSRFASLADIRNTLSQTVIASLIDGFMSIAVLMMMFVYSPQLSLVVLIILAGYIALRLVCFQPLKHLTEQQITAQAKEQTYFLESIRAIDSVKLFAREPQRLHAWLNKFIRTTNQEIRLGRWTITHDIVNTLLLGLEHILVIYFAAHLVLAGQLTVGMLFAFIAYKQHFTTSMVSLIQHILAMKMTALHLSRVADIALTKAESIDMQQGPVALAGKLSVAELSFRYADNETAIFEHLNMTFPAGRHIAIVGPSGEGKTTLLKLLLGLEEPTTGSVLIDDIPLAQLSKTHYRQQVAAVMQDDQLLSGSLLDNISFFDEQLDMQRVVTIAQQVGIHDDIMQMHMGYHSLVGTMGSALSGGQKQRILLARALYKQPKILFLDEATSHLDVSSEQSVSAAISRLDITRITIAHRPETIASADYIFCLQAGRLEALSQAQYHAIGR